MRLFTAASLFDCYLCSILGVVLGAFLAAGFYGFSPPTHLSRDFPHLSKGVRFKWKMRPKITGTKWSHRKDDILEEIKCIDSMSRWKTTTNGFLYVLVQQLFVQKIAIYTILPPSSSLQKAVPWILCKNQNYLQRTDQTNRPQTYLWPFYFHSAAKGPTEC